MLKEIVNEMKIKSNFIFNINLEYETSRRNRYNSRGKFRILRSF